MGELSTGSTGASTLGKGRSLAGRWTYSTFKPFKPYFLDILFPRRIGSCLCRKESGRCARHALQLDDSGRFRDETCAHMLMAGLYTLGAVYTDMSDLLGRLLLVSRSVASSSVMGPV